MSLSAVCIRRPVFTTMLILLPVVLGLVGLSRMGVDLFPNVDLPIVIITTTRQGASVEEMETGVTKKIEEAVNTISGIDELASTSREGISTVRIQFLLEKNRDVAQQEVQGKINTILTQLPTGTDIPIIDKFDLDAAPVMSISVSAPRPMKEVTEIADKQVSQALSSLPGVGAVTLTGGRLRAIQVTVDVDKMQAHGLSVQDVRAALGDQNLEVPGGRVDQNSRELTLRTMGRVIDPRQFNDIILKTVGNQPIRVRDIGHAEDSIEEPRSLSEVDGTNAVNLTVQKQSGTNTVEVIDGVKRKLTELQTGFGVEGKGDVQFKIVRDQSRFINTSMHEVKKHLILGAILVSLTILLFLRDWRTMLMASISIPVSIVSTFAAMNMMGYTLNNITMLALVMCVGLVIDDAVVVHENIFRWMEEKGYSAWDAAMGATKEIGLAVMATTFSLVVIFLPIAFMSGRVGRFFQSFGITMVCAILISLIVSFTLTPMLCSRFLKLSKKMRDALAHGDRTVLKQHHSGGVYGLIAERPYLFLLKRALRRRWVVIVAAFVVMLSLFPLPVGKWASSGNAKRAESLAWMNYPGLAGLVGMDFIPQDDQDEFEIAITTPSSYTLDRVREITKEIVGYNYYTVTPGADGFTLTYRGETTAPIPAKATADEVAAALGHLTIISGNQHGSVLEGLAEDLHLRRTITANPLRVAGPAGGPWRVEISGTGDLALTASNGVHVTHQMDGLLKLPHLMHTVLTIGDTSGKLTRATGDVTKASIYAQLSPLNERKESQFELMARARQLMARYPDLRSSVQIPAAVASGQANADIEVNLTGPELGELNRHADQILERMRQVPGLTDVDTTLPERKPELRVNIDRNRAAQFGLPVRTVADALQTLVGGQVIGDFKDESTGEQYDVWLRAQWPNRSTSDAIENMTIWSNNAGMVKLGNLARMEEERGPAQIDHFMRQRKITLVANLAFYTKHNQFLFFKWDTRDKMPTGDAVNAINQIIADMRADNTLPADYETSFGGRAKTLAESNSAFVMAFGLSLVFMYLILAAQFESFVHPITILLAIPLTIPFAVLSLVLFGQAMSLYGILGVFLLFGIIKKNGILQVDYSNVLRGQGMERNRAVLEANRTRLRPILMTTVMLVAGMTPIALGTGPGSASRAAMAKVIIGGQMLSLLLTLLVTPVAYTLFDDFGSKVRAIFGIRKPDAAGDFADEAPVGGHARPDASRAEVESLRVPIES